MVDPTPVELVERAKSFKADDVELFFEIYDSLDLPLVREDDSADFKHYVRKTAVQKPFSQQRNAEFALRIATETDLVDKLREIEQHNELMKLYKYLQTSLGDLMKPGTVGSKRKLEATRSAQPSKQQVRGPHAAGEAKATPPTMKDALYVKEMDDDESTKEKVRFVVVGNNNSTDNLIWLINLKEIFAKQLPKMPKEYIVRLVLDKNHRSMLAVQGSSVVGGICFRPYFDQQFGEIAFCAVSARHQVKGYGTKLMNQLKEYAKTINVTHFLTYADNYAIGYFKKQGFTKEISMPRERWVGYIKDYDGGTLMECVINEHIDYLKVRDMIKKQRQFVLNKIKEKSQTNTVYPGLGVFAEGHIIRNPYEEIPGVKEAGWRLPAAAVRKGGRDQSLFVSGLLGIFKQIHSHKDSWPFHEPVSETVTDYLQVVKHPIDLSLIKRRILSGSHYHSKKDFLKDLKLLCDNCRLYNGQDTNFFRCADSLESFFTPLIDAFDEEEVRKFDNHQVSAAQENNDTHNTEQQGG